MIIRINTAMECKQILNKIIIKESENSEYKKYSFCINDDFEDMIINATKDMYISVDKIKNQNSDKYEIILCTGINNTFNSVYAIKGIDYFINLYTANICVLPSHPDNISNRLILEQNISILYDDYMRKRQLSKNDKKNIIYLNDWKSTAFDLLFHRIQLLKEIKCIKNLIHGFKISMDYLNNTIYINKLCISIKMADNSFIIKDNLEKTYYRHKFHINEGDGEFILNRLRTIILSSYNKLIYQKTSTKNNDYIESKKILKGLSNMTEKPSNKNYYMKEDIKTLNIKIRNKIHSLYVYLDVVNHLQDTTIDLYLKGIKSDGTHSCIDGSYLKDISNTSYKYAGSEPKIRIILDDKFPIPINISYSRCDNSYDIEFRESGINLSKAQSIILQEEDE